MEATEPLGADPLFRRWGGMALTSCLLGRRVWTTIRAGRPLYPHLYVMLVATSGFGKSSTISAVRAALRDHTGVTRVSDIVAGAPMTTPQVVIAPTEFTFPRMIGDIGKVFKDRKRDEPAPQCYAILADEVGVILGKEAGITALQQLSKLWDMEEVYDKTSVRAQEQNRETTAYNHYITALLGAQPAWIEEAIPLSRFQLGMPARTHFVLGREEQERVFSQGTIGDFGASVRSALGPSMKVASSVAGYVEWTTEAFSHFTQWAGKRVGDEKRRDGSIGTWAGLMEGYGNRRAEHAAKLSLVIACSRGRESICVSDFAAALDLLWRTEEDLDAIMAMVGANPQRHKEDTIVEWVRERGGEVPEALVRAHMRNFFDTRMIGMTLDGLVTSGQLRVVARTFAPMRRFVV